MFLFGSPAKSILWSGLNSGDTDDAFEVQMRISETEGTVKQLMNAVGSDDDGRYDEKTGQNKTRKLLEMD